MKKIIFGLIVGFSLVGCVSGNNTVTTLSKTSGVDNVSLENKIGQMLMVGFFGTEAPPHSKICQNIKTYNLGGVILFDANPVDKSKAKNISSKEQLKKLTEELQACSTNKDLLIAVDQEGGRVQRLKSKYGFHGNFPKASEVGTYTIEDARATYINMSNELKSVGVNFNLAPVVDLSLNPKNVVINKLGRSYGTEPVKVSEYASVFLDTMQTNGIYTSLKHFPGHGSSLGDTHEGFVDVTKEWKEIELHPYQIMIDKGDIDSIMVAHVFNEKLDKIYPASLSSNTITHLLRNKMGYDGVVITDDLQMGAISSRYGLKNTLKLSINAGVDILLFGNQLNPNQTVSTKQLIETISQLVQKKEIDIAKIDSAFLRIKRLKTKY